MDTRTHAARPLLGFTEQPRPLTPFEREAVAGHAVVGAMMLEAAGFPAGVVRIARHHHERWDGTGVPDGLAGSAIPLDARVLAVADATVAMAERRNHAPARSLQQIRNELSAQRGRQFDSEIVARALQVLDWPAARAGYCDSHDRIGPGPAYARFSYLPQPGPALECCYKTIWGLLAAATGSRSPRETAGLITQGLGLAISIRRAVEYIANQRRAAQVSRSQSCDFPRTLLDPLPLAKSTLPRCPSSVNTEQTDVPVKSRVALLPALMNVRLRST